MADVRVAAYGGDLSTRVTNMPNELQGVLAILVICAPLIAYGIYAKRRSDRLGRLIAAEEESERQVAAQIERN